MATVEQTSTGVSFALTDEQKELRSLAREFAAKEIRPKAAEYDEHSTHPADVIAKAHSLGLMNLHVPETYGGLGLAAFDGMLVGEELNWGCSGIGTSISANGLGAGPVIIAGTDEQKARWLPPLLEEPILCSFGLSEPGAGSDVARMGTTAERRGDEYVLNGSKTFITNAGHAAWTVVFAKTDPKKGHRGISAFVVPMDTPGVTIEKHLDKMGQRSTDTSAFALADVVVPAENRLGEEGEGFKIIMRALQPGRVNIAAKCVGLAQACFEEAVRYANDRTVRGQPIGKFQMIQDFIAEMAVAIEASRALVYKAAYCMDNNLPSNRIASIAKYHASQTAKMCADKTQQIFGGYGFAREYRVSWYRVYADMLYNGEGSANIQKIILAEDALGYKVADRYHGKTSLRDVRKTDVAAAAD